jgi:hypothetical protein
MKSAYTTARPASMSSVIAETTTSRAITVVPARARG